MFVIRIVIVNHVVNIDMSVSVLSLKIDQKFEMINALESTPFPYGFQTIICFERCR